MKKQVVAPIAVDLGARNTGVFFSHWVRGEAESGPQNSHGVVLSLSPKDFTASVRARTGRRHQRRGYQRKKLARRLLLLILEKHFDLSFSSLSAQEQTALFGLLKRRGFTYLGDDVEVYKEVLRSANPEWFSALFGDTLFDGQTDIFSQYQRIVSDSEKLAALQGHPFFELRKIDFKKPVRLPASFVAQNKDKLVLLGKDWKKFKGIASGKKNQHEWSAHCNLLKELLHGIVSSNEDFTEFCERVRVDEKVVKALKKSALFNLDEFHFQHPDSFVSKEFCEYLGNDLNDFQDAYTAFKDSIDIFVKSLASGHKPREQYLSEIREEFQVVPTLSRIADRCGVSAQALANLVGHVSNLQLRVLRKYFNEKQMAHDERWCPYRFGKFFFRSVKSWHVEKGTKSAERRFELLKWRSKPVIETLLNVDSKVSIPPFEDQNNRRPPRCQSLILSAEKLRQHFPEWESVANLFYLREREYFEDLSPSSGNNSRTHLERVLQRVFDRKASEDRYAMRKLCKDLSIESSKVTERGLRDALDELRLCGLSAEQIERLRRTGETYYGEVRKAKDGVWDSELPDNLLSVCGCQTPHKRRLARSNIAAILRVPLSDSEFHQVKALFLEPRKIERSSIAGICKKAADAQKEFGVSMGEVIRRSPEKNIKSLVRKCSSAAAEISNFLEKQLNKQSVDPDKFSSPFSFAQLHNILFEDPHGFGRTCRTCSEENEFRGFPVGLASSGGRASRLPAFVVRPFDGVLRKVLERTASEIANAQVRYLTQYHSSIDEILIPLIVEENRFTFSKEIVEIKKEYAKTPAEKIAIKTTTKNFEKQQGYEEKRFDEKRDRIIEASCNICPYLGKAIGNYGELDHIIPRSVTTRFQGTIFNSEANLIYTSAEGNAQRGNREYSLADLHNHYLMTKFHTTDRQSIEANIREGLEEIKKNSKKIVFQDLDAPERDVVRHALFVPVLRAQISELLSGAIVAGVNGTQRYLLTKITSALKSEFKRLKLCDAIRFKAISVRPEDIHLFRKTLTEGNKEFEKSDKQSPYSHCIDATLAFLYSTKFGSLSAKIEEYGGELESSFRDWLPASIDRKPIRRAPWYRRKNVKSLASFNDTIFGERYVPLFVLKREGRLRLGFSKSNSFPVQNPDAWLRTLHPFFKNPEVRELDSVEKLEEKLKEASYEEIRFSLCKRLVQDFLHQRFWQSDDQETSEIGKILECLRYFVVKTEVWSRSGLLDKDNNLPPTFERCDLSKRCKITVGDLPKQFKVMDKPNSAKNKVSLRYPEYYVWKSLYEKLVRGSDGIDEGVNADLQIQRLRHFFRDTGTHSDSSRKKVRKTFSLGIVKNPSGGFRVKRGSASNGTHVWQILEAPQVYAGFVLRLKHHHIFIHQGNSVLHKPWGIGNRMDVSRPT